MTTAEFDQISLAAALIATAPQVMLRELTGPQAFALVRQHVVTCSEGRQVNAELLRELVQMGQIDLSRFGSPKSRSLFIAGEMFSWAGQLMSRVERAAAAERQDEERT